MRELKFRVWSKTLQGFLPKEEWCLDFDGKLIFVEMCSSPIPGDCVKLLAINPELYVVQQFTGLKDKNGKEIYEGDIIKTVKRGDESVFYIGECRFEDNRECGATDVLGYWFVSKDVVLSFMRYKFPYFSFEVIGNIFENPELINEKI